MASYYLVNPVRLGTVVFKAGAFLDDAIHDIAGIQKAGGLLLSSSNADAAAAARDAADARLRGDDLMATSLMIAGAIKAGSSPSRVYPLDANHIHAWEMDDASGTTLADSGSGVRVPLTLSGGILQTEGLTGKCVQFGTSTAGADATEKATALVSAFSDLPTGSVTLDLWYRSYVTNLGYIAGVDVVGAGRFVIDGNAAAAGQLAGTVQATGFKYFASPTLRIVSQGYAWHHVGLVYDQGSGLCSIYLDGEVAARATGQTGSVSWSTGTTPTFGIATGQNAAGSYRGQISRVRLSNIARPQSYFRAVYAKGMGFAAT